MTFRISKQDSQVLDAEITNPRPRDFIKSYNSFNVLNDNIFLGTRSVNPITLQDYSKPYNDVLPKIEQNTLPPVLFSAGPQSSIESRYAKAHFDEQDRRAYEESILEKTGLDTVMPPILANYEKFRAKAQNPLNQPILNSVIPPAPTPPSMESIFTKNIKSQKVKLENTEIKDLTRMLEQSLDKSKVSQTPRSPVWGELVKESPKETLKQPANLRKIVEGKAKKPFNPNKMKKTG